MWNKESTNKRLFNLNCLALSLCLNSWELEAEPELVVTSETFKEQALLVTFKSTFAEGRLASAESPAAGVVVSSKTGAMLGRGFRKACLFFKIVWTSKIINKSY